VPVCVDDQCLCMCFCQPTVHELWGLWDPSRQRWLGTWCLGGGPAAPAALLCWVVGLMSLLCLHMYRRRVCLWSRVRLSHCNTACLRRVVVLKGSVQRMVRRQARVYGCAAKRTARVAVGHLGRCAVCVVVGWLGRGASGCRAMPAGERKFVGSGRLAAAASAGQDKRQPRTHAVCRVRSLAAASRRLLSATGREHDDAFACQARGERSRGLEPHNAARCGVLLWFG
jgi:hypothetical protein